MIQFKKTLLSYFWLTLSSAFAAITVNFFFTHSHLAPGGITGFSIVISSITHLSVEIISLCISIPLLIAATLVLGKSFGLKTLYVTILSPLLMYLLPKIDLLAQLNIPHTLSLLLSAIICGIFIGCSISLALRNECATGGTDVAALLIQKMFKHLDLNSILFALDGFITLASGLINKDFTITLFSLVALSVSIKTIAVLTNQEPVPLE